MLSRNFIFLSLQMFDFDEQLDVKQTNITYPRVNNENVLEFVFPPHPNLFLRKNKIAIRGTVQLDQKYIPDNGFASKVRVNFNYR